jgi:SAM-dependent methyltransferase
LSAIKSFIRAWTPSPIYEAANRAKVKVMEIIGAAPAVAKTYQELFAERATELCPLAGSKVLVVGANTGADCKLFIDRGAAEVHGLDVIEDVGKEFPHERVTYHQSGIEHTDLPSNYFDMVCAVATMEHVPDIKAGFSEMERLARPSGMIYSVAAPLWQSPYGHHMECFDGHPWIHLVFERDDLIQYARSHGIEGERGHGLEDIVDYMLNPAFFNMKPSSLYIEACAQLRGVDIHQNDLAREDASLLMHSLGRKAIAKGYLADDLLAVTHTFVARKKPTPT